MVVPNERLLRWSLTLQQYDFGIKYRRGDRNANADALSRQNYSTVVNGLNWNYVYVLIIKYLIFMDY